jgi:D-3-phosphoglycerate dehydrogenase
MKIAVVGDSYCPASALAPAFATLAKSHAVTFADLRDEPDWVPSSPSDERIKEYLGSPRQVIDLLGDADVLVMQAAPVTDAVFDADPRLKLLCVARGGPVNVDVAAATERHIPVIITPGKNAQAVTELTIALMIVLARRVPENVRYLEGGGDLGRDNYEGARWFGHDLEGRTLGVVGFGQIGRKVTRLALAFGMRVLVHDPFVDAGAIDAAGAASADLDTLVAGSDFVSLHARISADNRGMIGRDQFAHMKEGAILINTARDALVDEDALYDALRSGRLAGAGLDLVRPADLSVPARLGSRHRLLEFPNVVIVSHIGGSTWETLLHGGEMAAAEIERMVAGEPFRNLANPAALSGVEVAAHG